MPTRRRRSERRTTTIAQVLAQLPPPICPPPPPLWPATEQTVTTNATAAAARVTVVAIDAPTLLTLPPANTYDTAWWLTVHSLDDNEWPVTVRSPDLTIDFQLAPTENAWLLSDGQTWQHFA